MATSQKEAVISIDKFRQPMVLEGSEAIATLLVRIIELEPGTIPSHPTMGVGLVSNYRNCDEEKAKALRQHVMQQIAVYLPKYQAVDVNTYLSSGKLVIDITIDQTLYRYEAVQDANQNKTIIGLNRVMEL